MDFKPILATRQSALPEFITDGETGIMLDLPLNKNGEWRYAAVPDRHTKSFEQLCRDEVQRLAEEALEAVVDLVAEPACFFAMRRRSWKSAVKLFAAEGANRFWDDFYARAAQGDRASSLPKAEGLSAARRLAPRSCCDRHAHPKHPGSRPRGSYQGEGPPK